MSRFLSVGTIVSSLLMLVGCGSSAPEAGSEAPASTEVQPLGTFLFEVDTSLPPDQMVKVSDITAVTKPITRPGRVAQAATDVTSNVSVYNATTPVFTTSGSGGYTTVKFGVWNQDGTNALDEPYLQITSITVASGSGTVTFAENSTPGGHTFVSSALGSHTGGTYYLADMNKKCTGVGSGCTSSQKDFAVQMMKINVSSYAMKYNFVAAVYATTTSGTTGIYPDLDQDTWNTEPYSQKAGGDCNDSSSSTPYATCGSSGCASSCPTSSSSSCPSSGSSSNCCSQTGATGSLYCPNTTPACTCDATFGGSGGSITCASGSSCNGTYPSSGGGNVDVNCSAGATCNLDCSNNSGVTTHCEMHGCDVGSCTMTCPAGQSAYYFGFLDTAVCL